MTKSSFLCTTLIFHLSVIICFAGRVSLSFFFLVGLMHILAYRLLISCHLEVAPLLNFLKECSWSQRTTKWFDFQWQQSQHHMDIIFYRYQLVSWFCCSFFFPVKVLISFRSSCELCLTRANQDMGFIFTYASMEIFFICGNFIILWRFCSFFLGKSVGILQLRECITLYLESFPRMLSKCWNISRRNDPIPLSVRCWSSLRPI